jgi:hypothetical protein
MTGRPGKLCANSSESGLVDAAERLIVFAAMNQEEPDEKKCDGPPPAVVSSGHRLLVVDDNKDAADSLAIIGWGQPEDRRRSAKAGFDHHLVKPPEPKILETLLAELKSRRA